MLNVFHWWVELITKSKDIKDQLLNKDKRTISTLPFPLKFSEYNSIIFSDCLHLICNGLHSYTIKKEIIFRIQMQHHSCRMPNMSSSLNKWNLQEGKDAIHKISIERASNTTRKQIQNDTYSLSSSLICVPPYSGNRTRSPSLTDTGMKFPALSRDPGPTAITFPELSCFNATQKTWFNCWEKNKKNNHTKAKRWEEKPGKTSQEGECQR